MNEKVLRIFSQRGIYIALSPFSMKLRLPLLIGALAFIATPAFAATLMSGDNVSLKNPVNDDLYMAGSSLSINKDINGDVAGQVRAEPWWNLFYGFVYLVLTPFIGMLLMVTIFGLPLGVLTLVLYVFSIIFLAPVTALVLTKLTQDYYKTKWGKGMVFLISIGFYIVLKLLNLVPVIGWVAKLLLYAVVLGALCVTKTKKMQKIL